MLNGQSVLAGYIDSHEYIALGAMDLAQRQRIEYAAVHKQTALPLYRLEEQWDRD